MKKCIALLLLTLLISTITGCVDAKLNIATDDMREDQMENSLNPVREQKPAARTALYNEGFNIATNYMRGNRWGDSFETVKARASAAKSVLYKEVERYSILYHIGDGILQGLQVTYYFTEDKLVSINYAMYGDKENSSIYGAYAPISKQLKAAYSDGKHTKNGNTEWTIGTDAVTLCYYDDRRIELSCTPNTAGFWSNFEYAEGDFGEPYYELYIESIFDDEIYGRLLCMATDRGQRETEIRIKEKIVDGKAHFSFEDSFGNQGNGVLVFLSDSAITLTVDITQPNPNARWSMGPCDTVLYKY